MYEMFLIGAQLLLDSKNLDGQLDLQSYFLSMNLSS